MANGQTAQFHKRLAGVFVMCAVAVSCSVLPQRPVEIAPLSGQIRYEVESVDWLALSEPMRRFVRNHAPKDLHSTSKAWNLAYASLDPMLLNFHYDPSLTLTASETFKRHAGNCLSFSSMFVALAREAGLEAWFQEVKVPPDWSAVNEVYLVSMHINAVVQDARSEYIVDVSGTSRARWSRVRRLTDAEAKAQYYNNLGAEALVEHKLPQAYAYFVKALETAPKASYIWSNLGVVYNRNGQLSDAKSAYMTALRINSSETTALNNLHSIYMQEGAFEEAERVQAKVEKQRRNNPWYLHLLSTQAVEEHHYEEAIALLQRAIKLNRKEYRFHYALARSQFLSGDTDAAQSSLNRAKALAPDKTVLHDIELADLSSRIDS